MRRAAIRILLGIGLAVSAVGGASAQQQPRIDVPPPAHFVQVEIGIYHASPRPGPIAANAADLHRRLHREFRYESLRQLTQRSVRLEVDQIGAVQLPTGRWVRVRPLAVRSDGVLMAVEVEGSLQTDLRMRRQRRVVIGAPPYKGGKLVITLMPDF